MGLSIRLSTKGYVSEMKGVNVGRTSFDGWFFRSVEPSILLLLVGLLIAFDLASEIVSGISWHHIFLEGALFLGVILAALGFWQRLRSERVLWKKEKQAILNETEQLRTAYETCQEHAQVCEETNRSYAEGLSRSIDEQFEQWSLSQAETEIARLLLKGLALKEIAAIRKVSERTARDQARAVYRKSSLANRNELAAFFLEDLLQPVDAAKENP